MDNSSSIRGIIVLVSTLALALWLGVSLVTNQTETLIYVAGASMLITCIFLGRKIWLLLVLFMALNVPLIRGFGTVELGQSLFVGFTFTIFLMRRQPLNMKFGEMDFWMLLVAGCIVQVYLRNPVGLNIFGAGSVGARPYFMVTLGFVSAVVLGRIVVPAPQLRWAMLLSMTAAIVGVFLSVLRMRTGGAAGYEKNAKLSDGRDSDRIGGLASLATAIARPVATVISPLRACLHPIFAPLILLSLAAAAGSGFRNSVAEVGMIYLVGLAYRGGFGSVMFSILSCSMALGVLAVVNLVAPLPPNIQRALSPFPGTWEERYVEAADVSTEWRVEMWKEALFTDYWIHDKIFGDGLGLTREEYELIAEAEEGGRGLGSMGSGMSAQQEAMMIVGGYHSGPVQCVRTIGYVGLGILILAMIRIAVHAHRQIKRCRGTEYYNIALYFGIPSIVLPFMYVFIFGDFGRDVSALFYSYGMLSLLTKNLPLPAYVIPKRVPYILNNRNLQRPIADEQPV